MPTTHDRPALYFFNLTFLVIFGVLVSFWVLHYTDYFPIVGGLLGLGGAFAWIAFLARVVNEKRKQWLEDKIDGALQHLASTGILLLVGVMFFIFLPASHGTIIVDAIGDSVVRTVELRRAETEGRIDPESTVSRIRMAPRTEQRILLGSGWFSARQYMVQPDRLPGTTINVRFLTRKRLVVPEEFLTIPVVLLRPAPGVGATAARGQFDLIVHVDGDQVAAVPSYDGSAVWVGTGSQVDVPTARQDRWRLELAARGYPEVVMTAWSHPQLLKSVITLIPGQQITAKVVRQSDGGTYAQGSAQVRQVDSTAAFPQEIVLDVVDQARD